MLEIMATDEFDPDIYDTVDARVSTDKDRAPSTSPEKLPTEEDALSSAEVDSFKDRNGQGNWSNLLWLRVFEVVKRDCNKQIVGCIFLIRKTTNRKIIKITLLNNSFLKHYQYYLLTCNRIMCNDFSMCIMHLYVPIHFR